MQHLVGILLQRKSLLMPFAKLLAFPNLTFNNPNLFDSFHTTSQKYFLNNCFQFFSCQNFLCIVFNKVGASRTVFPKLFQSTDLKSKKKNADGPQNYAVDHFRLDFFTTMLY